MENGTYVTLVFDASPPIGGSNKDWINYAKKERNLGRNPFPCEGNFLAKIVSGENETRQVNNTNASLFLFHLLYLQNLWQEFGTKPALASTADITLLDTQTSSVQTTLNCVSLCADENSRCLLFNYRDGDSDGSLKRLHDELLKRPPLTITQEQLWVDIFHLPKNDPMMYFRNANAPTTINESGVLENKGEDGTIKYEHHAAVKAELFFPSLLRAQVHSKDRDLAVVFSK